MKSSRKLLSLALALLMIASFAACSAAKTAAPEMSNLTSDMAAPQAAEEYTAGKSLSLGGGETPAENLEKIIYSGDAEIETREFDETIKKLNALIEGQNGFIQSSSVTGNNYGTLYSTESHRRAYYEIRIPADGFESFMELIETLGNIPYSSTNAENISAQYRDLDARLTTYRAQEKRYLELLDKAETVEDILRIESYLTEIRYQIESCEAQKRSWDSLISYSTLTIRVTEVAVYTDKENNPFALSYGEQLSETLSGSLRSTGRFFKAFFKFLVGALPVLVILAVITVPVLLIIRAHNRKKKASASTEADNGKE